MIDALLYRTKRQRSCGYGEPTRFMPWYAERSTHPVLADDFEEFNVTLSYTYRPATADYYDASIGGPGGWSPGDSAEAELIEARDPDGCLVILTDDEDKIALEYIYENHNESDYSPDPDDWRDDRLDDEMRGYF